MSDHALSSIAICPESPKCESMLAIGDVQGNINILKIGDSLLKFEDNNERIEIDGVWNREKNREASIIKKRKKVKNKKQVKEEEHMEFDTEKLEMEFYKELGLDKKE